MKKIKGQKSKISKSYPISALKFAYCICSFLNITSSLSSSFVGCFLRQSLKKEVAPACVSRGSDARRLSVHKSCAL